MTRSFETNIARTSLAADAFSSDTFAMIVPTRRGEHRITAQLTQWGDELFITKIAAMVKASYTDADRAESARLDSETPVRDGDVITVNGRDYRVTVVGDFMDPARLTAI